MGGGEMELKFWGTCGSLPAPINAQSVNRKIIAALQAAQGQTLDTREAMDKFIANLPFWVRGTYGGNTPCVEIVGGDDFVIIDAGTGLRDLGTHLMAQGTDRLPGRFHILMSHLHWDHIQGFPFFPPAYIPGNKIIIYGCHDEIEIAFRHQQGSPVFPVAFDHLGADIQFVVFESNKPHEIAGFNVTTMQQDHPNVSYGYRIEKDGKVAVYSSDSEHRDDMHRPNYRFLDFYRDADVLVFDAQYTLADAVHHKEDWGHSSNIIAVELAVQSGVKHLCLFHLEHTHSDETLHQMFEDTKGYAEFFSGDSTMKISLAYDGLEVPL
ncbi:MAG: hypothetical protein COS85_02700 [Armatimonadetes bacterium CG07_land_8_20_14_0_80_59_28]|nr:MAG: hypothetical protein COS85_02700 [Armatimonadetes bacterium CG07_land_8_20_14_0_80_59_28]PIX40112.1 MAG: hypothetical protein COZ56_15565 [Armatimonadetes bacterium CG_4_8_14_3_um_filter_58_9]PIY49312.1 MAG: hypothetical protein COZ05_00760 [Armatimonadetes bacterium CG_4_10_14_3_um_filter_59_10]PJB75960.1 MAG: hypothetical protein CO095_03135 [Armatimonadetes bacterium CG_4_9_14_3_um_filter_58_7]